MVNPNKKIKPFNYLQYEYDSLESVHRFVVKGIAETDKQIIEAIANGKGMTTTQSKKRLERFIKEYTEEALKLGKGINLYYLMTWDQGNLSERVEKMDHRLRSDRVKYLKNKICIATMKIKSL